LRGGRRRESGNAAAVPGGRVQNRRKNYCVKRKFLFSMLNKFDIIEPNKRKFNK
jgi:hypothetical protein